MAARMLPPDRSQFPTTVLPSAIQQDTSTGTRNTTEMMNPLMDQWFKRLAGVEGQAPDAQGVTHLTLAQAKGSPSLVALKGLL